MVRPANYRAWQEGFGCQLASAMTSLMRLLLLAKVLVYVILDAKILGCSLDVDSGHLSSVQKACRKLVPIWGLWHLGVLVEEDWIVRSRFDAKLELKHLALERN